MDKNAIFNDVRMAAMKLVYYPTSIQEKREVSE